MFTFPHIVVYRNKTFFVGTAENRGAFNVHLKTILKYYLWNYGKDIFFQSHHPR